MKRVLFTASLILLASNLYAQPSTVNGLLPQLPTVLDVSGGMKVACITGCSAGGGTTDIDDGTIASGQTAGLLIGLGYYYNGTNWVRVAGTASGINVVCASGCAGSATDVDDGSVASGQTESLVLNTPYIYNGATWARLTFGQATMANSLPVTIASNQSALSVTATNSYLLDATYTGRMPAGASPANGESNTNTALSRIGGYNFIYNGTTWDRWTGAISGTVSANAGSGTFTTQETTPATIFNGKTTVTTAGTRVTLASSTTVRSVTVCALQSNTGLIYLGNSTVASTNGRAMAAGECQSLAIANLNTINLDSAVNGEGVTYIAVN